MPGRSAGAVGAWRQAWVAAARALIDTLPDNAPEDRRSGFTAPRSDRAAMRVAGALLRAADMMFASRYSTRPTAMPTLWGRRTSSNVQKVLWLCAELGVPLRRIDAGLQHGVVDTPEYALLNPNRLVPTLDDDGLVLWESNTIVRYLARRHGGSSWLPGEPAAAALVERWMDWALSTLPAAMSPLYRQLVLLPAEQRDPEVAEKARRDAERAMRILEAELARQDHVAADGITVADIACGPLVHRWHSLPIERPELPALRRYHARLCARPAYREHVAIPLGA